MSPPRAPYLLRRGDGGNQTLVLAPAQEGSSSCRSPRRATTRSSPTSWSTPNAAPTASSRSATGDRGAVFATNPPLTCGLTGGLPAGEPAPFPQTSSATSSPSSRVRSSRSGGIRNRYGRPRTGDNAGQIGAGREAHETSSGTARQTETVGSPERGHQQRGFMICPDLDDVRCHSSR